jgi:hypothetical protein
MEHRRRKSRTLDDGSVNKFASINEVHKIYNDYQNEQLKNKYAEKTKEFLKKHGIEL